jgi:hypothetical protein
VNEILAKLTQNEKLIGLGAVGVALGWLVGQVLASVNPCGDLGSYGAICPSVNYFTWGNAGLMAILALLAAIALIVVIYLKNSSTTITWPMPVVQIVLGLAVAALVLAALTVLMQMNRGIDGAPIGMWIADVLLVGGGAVAAYGAYMDWTVSKS